jgi:hypothetical protein
MQPHFHWWIFNCSIGYDVIDAIFRAFCLSNNSCNEVSVPILRSVRRRAVRTRHVDGIVSHPQLFVHACFQLYLSWMPGLPSLKLEVFPSFGQHMISGYLVSSGHKLTFGHRQIARKVLEARQYLGSVSRTLISATTNQPSSPSLAIVCISPDLEMDDPVTRYPSASHFQF